MQESIKNDGVWVLLLGWDPQPAASVTKSPNFWAGTPNRPPLLQKVRTFGLGPPTGRLCYKKSELLGWDPQPAASVTKSPNFWAGTPNRPPLLQKVPTFGLGAPTGRLCYKKSELLGWGPPTPPNEHNEFQYAVSPHITTC